MKPALKVSPLIKQQQAASQKPAKRETTYSMPGATAGGILGNALQALWSNRQRSVLTMLGIIIGIAAFISVVTLSQGATTGIVSKYQFLATVLSVNPASGSTNETPFILTEGDYKAMAKLSHVTNTTPYISNKAEIINGHQTWSTSMLGVASCYQAIQDQLMVISEGSWWTDAEEQGRRPVVVLGATVAKNTFAGGEDPIGKTVRIDRQLYRVIAVLQASGSSSQDNIVYVPYTVALNPLAVNPIQSIGVQADSVDNIDMVDMEMKILLEQRHHIQPGARDGFEIAEAITQLQQGEQSLSILSTLMVSIAAFSLLVGGVGIMNIMLVSVTERTREIGLRAALGAQPWDICFQFLLEALTLSLIGGGIGLLLGLLMAYGVTNLAHFPFILNISSFVLGFGVATAIGVGFGLYPAIRASRLDPIVALRSA